jgi:hypothetical protein
MGVWMMEVLPVGQKPPSSNGRREGARFLHNRTATPKRTNGTGYGRSDATSARHAPPHKGDLAGFKNLRLPVQMSIPIKAARETALVDQRALIRTQPLTGSRSKTLPRRPSFPPPHKGELCLDSVGCAHKDWPYWDSPGAKSRMTRTSSSGRAGMWRRFALKILWPNAFWVAARRDRPCSTIALRSIRQHRPAPHRMPRSGSGHPDISMTTVPNFAARGWR